MSKDRRDAFKIGFLQKCAEAGFTAEETTNLAKQAADRMEKDGGWLSAPVNETSKFIGKAIGNAGRLALWAPLLGAPVAGAAAGYGLSRITDIDDDDVEAAKERELIELYRSHADRLRST